MALVSSTPTSFLSYFVGLIFFHSHFLFHLPINFFLFINRVINCMLWVSFDSFWSCWSFLLLLIDVLVAKCHFWIKKLTIFFHWVYPVSNLIRFTTLLTGFFTLSWRFSSRFFKNEILNNRPNFFNQFSNIRNLTFERITWI